MALLGQVIAYWFSELYVCRYCALGFRRDWNIDSVIRLKIVSFPGDMVRINGNCRNFDSVVAIVCRVLRSRDVRL